jgi:enoyl-[acyl-carrier protein] reductase II
MSGSARLDMLMARGTAFLGTRYAIMAGAMTWVSERHLVSAISNAGGFGVIACGAMPPEMLAGEIAATQALTDKPFGVNLITLHPQMMDLIGVCADAGVSHVVLAGGLPSGAAIDAIKAAGMKLMCFAPALALAKKLVRSGVDALVIEGSEAGGHIGRGSAIAAYLEMGAAGVQLGTRFVCATESVAHPNFKRAFIRAAARDAIASVQLDPRLPVIPVRALKNAGTEAFTAKQREIMGHLDAGAVELAEAQLQIEHYWAGALRRAVVDGDVETGSLMAGQSVGMVTKEEPAADIIAELVADAAAALDGRGARAA